MYRTSNRAWLMKVVALLILSGSVLACASAKKVALRQTTAESAWSFASGDYGKALGSYQKLYEKARTNGKVVSGYAAMIEEVKAAGDEARGKGGFAAAQGAYRVVLDGWDGFSAIAPRLSFKKSELEEGIRDCRLALCERQFRQELGAGNYLSALAAYQTMLKNYSGDKTVQASYVKGIGEIRAAGDKALAAKDYALAGKVIGLLLKNLESFEAFAGTTAGGGLSKQELTEALRACSSELTNGGLAEYRKGNLESAITLWDNLLDFDPANAEIKKAVETAKAQLGKVKNSGRGGGRSGRSERGAH